MTTVLIVIHLMVVLAMIGLVLLQRSEGGALGIGSGQGAFLTGRGAGNVLTRATAVLAAVFFATSIGLALLAKYESQPSDAIERLDTETAPSGTEAPAPTAPLGTPESAEDLLRQLGGPQAPPADAGQQAPAPESNAADTNDVTVPPAPVESPAPADQPAQGQ